KRRRAGCAKALLISRMTPLISTLLFSASSRRAGRADFSTRPGVGIDSEGRRSCFVAGAAHRIDQRLDARLAGVVLDLDLAGVETYGSLLNARQGIQRLLDLRNTGRA